MRQAQRMVTLLPFVSKSTERSISSSDAVSSNVSSPIVSDSRFSRFMPGPTSMLTAQRRSRLVMMSARRRLSNVSLHAIQPQQFSLSVCATDMLGSPRKRVTIWSGVMLRAMSSPIPDTLTLPRLSATCTGAKGQFMASNAVPVTSTTRLSSATVNGRVSSWATSKYASPSSVTARAERLKSPLQLSRLSELSHTSVPSGRIQWPFDSGADTSMVLSSASRSPASPSNDGANHPAENTAATAAAAATGRYILCRNPLPRV